MGRDGLAEWKSRGFKYNFVTLEVKNIIDADAIGNNPIYKNGELIGRATSGGYGFRVNKSIALAMINPDYNEIGKELEINILGKNYNCLIINESPYDEENIKIKA